MTPPPSLTIVGLGPGDPDLLTIEARDVLSTATEVWLRTSRHPAIAGLPAGPRYESFDAAYDRGTSFVDVYETILGRVLELAARPQGCVYAVPGHPLFGEATVRGLLARAPDAGISFRIVSGVSFVDAISAALQLDPLEHGALILDALDLPAHGRGLLPQRPTLIAQVYDRRAASQVKLALLEVYPPEHPMRIVRASATMNATVIERSLAELDRWDDFDHLTAIYAPPIASVEDLRSFEGLRAVVARLRDPDGGCPWDLQQTHESLRRYLLEEAYEALDALDAGDPHRLAEELGDLMMQVVLHAQLAEDAGDFVVEDVISSIITKLIRRHPHVFGDLEVRGAQDVLRNWEILKKEERGDGPLLDHVPVTMPALMQAQSVQSRAERAAIGPAVPDARSIEVALDALRDGHADAAALGDLLFGIVAMARARDLDSEDALRAAVSRYRGAVAAEEQAGRRI